MIKSFTATIFCLCTLSLFALPAAAQDNLRVTVANLSQDLNLLAQNVKTMRLEMEELGRENARLRAQVAASSSNRETETQISNLSSAIETLRREYRAADADQKQQILTEVNRQISVLAKETQAAINTIAKAVDSQPKIAAPSVHFSDDYPSKGKTYIVRSGDTLSKIARDHGSTVKDLQNANEIANPSHDLQVGQSIFIPISQ